MIFIFYTYFLYFPFFIILYYFHLFTISYLLVAPAPIIPWKSAWSGWELRSAITSTSSPACCRCPRRAHALTAALSAIIPRSTSLGNNPRKTETNKKMTCFSYFQKYRKLYFALSRISGPEDAQNDP